jgi:hypothetical protein
MSDQVDSNEKSDAIAAVMILVIVVATAIYWVSSQ